MWWRRGRRPWCLGRGGRWLASGELAYSSPRHSCSYSSGTHLVTHTAWPTHPPSAPPRAALTLAPATLAAARLLGTGPGTQYCQGCKKGSSDWPKISYSPRPATKDSDAPEGHAHILSSALRWKLMLEPILSQTTKRYYQGRKKYYSILPPLAPPCPGSPGEAFGCWAADK